MTQKDRVSAEAEKLVMTIVSKVFKQSIDQESVRAVAGEVSKAVPTERSKRAA